MDNKDNGNHDAENKVDQDSDDDPERVLSGKMSESSGYAGSDLYNYKVLSLSVSVSACLSLSPFACVCVGLVIPACYLAEISKIVRFSTH